MLARRAASSSLDTECNRCARPVSLVSRESMSHDLLNQCPPARRPGPGMDLMSFPSGGKGRPGQQEAFRPALSVTTDCLVSPEDKSPAHSMSCEAAHYMSCMCNDGVTGRGTTFRNIVGLIRATEVLIRTRGRAGACTTFEEARGASGGRNRCVLGLAKLGTSIAEGTGRSGPRARELCILSKPENATRTRPSCQSQPTRGAR